MRISVQFRHIIKKVLNHRHHPAAFVCGGNFIFFTTPALLKNIQAGTKLFIQFLYCLRHHIAKHFCALTTAQNLHFVISAELGIWQIRSRDNCCPHRHSAHQTLLRLRSIFYFSKTLSHQIRIFTQKAISSAHNGILLVNNQSGTAQYCRHTCRKRGISAKTDHTQRFLPPQHPNCLHDSQRGFNQALNFKQLRFSDNSTGKHRHIWNLAQFALIIIFAAFIRNQHQTIASRCQFFCQCFCRINMSTGAAGS